MTDDERALSVLQNYYTEHMVLPSYAALGESLGLSSKGSVSLVVTRLMDEGFLAFAPDKRLKPGARFFERYVFDSVQAGTPNAATDNPPEAITIDRFLIKEPSRTVLIRVKGDSMIEAGIFAGDLAVVERRPSANVGDIVVATVENEFTLKFLDRDRKGYFLRPANAAFQPIRGDFELFGVMVGLVRRL